MKNPKTFLLLAVVVAVLLLGIAYAAIANITLNVNGNVVASPSDANFQVAFDDSEGKTTTTGAGEISASVESEKAAIMNVTGLTEAGQVATAKFTIKNTSEDIKAIVTSNESNNNPTYFEVTSSLEPTTIDAKTGTSILTVNVKLIKNPVAAEEKATIGVTINAEPQA